MQKINSKSTSHLILFCIILFSSSFIFLVKGTDREVDDLDRHLIRLNLEQLGNWMKKSEGSFESVMDNPFVMREAKNLMEIIQYNNRKNTKNPFTAYEHEKRLGKYLKLYDIVLDNTTLRQIVQLLRLVQLDEFIRNVANKTLPLNNDEIFEFIEKLLSSFMEDSIEFPEDLSDSLRVSLLNLKAKYPSLEGSFQLGYDDILSYVSHYLHRFIEFGKFYKNEMVGRELFKDWSNYLIGNVSQLAYRQLTHARGDEMDSLDASIPSASILLNNIRNIRKMNRGKEELVDY